MGIYRVGVVGLGRMGSTIDEEGHSDLPYSIAASCNASDRLNLVSGADLRSERRKAFQKKWGVENLYEDFKEMVENEKLDLVAICTTASGLQKPARSAPNSNFREDAHADLAISLSDAKVPMIYLEKAMASSLEKADKIREAVIRNKTLINTGVLRRFDNRYEAVKNAISSGKIGDPKFVIHFAGSTLMHGHIHSIDTVSYLIGDPQINAVRGELFPRDLKITENHLASDPQATYQLLFDNGVEAWSIPGAYWEFEVIGTEGTIRLLNNGSSVSFRKSSSPIVRKQDWDDVMFPSENPKSTVVTCLEDLVNAYETGISTRDPIHHSHHITEACIAVAESHRQQGNWVELPMEERDLYIFHI